MKFYTIDSSDDDEPLTKNKPKKETQKTLSKDELYKKNVQKCFLCNDVLFNNYEVLVHNAQHIIIPVQKYECHQCRECLSLFVTKQQLYMHVLYGHPEIINAPTEELPTKVNGIQRHENAFTETDLPSTTVHNGIQEVLQNHNGVKDEDTIVLDDDSTDEESKPENEMLSVIENMVKKQPIIVCKTPLQINNEAIKLLKNDILEKCVKQKCVVLCDYDDEIANFRIPNSSNALPFPNKDTSMKPFTITCSPGALTITPIGCENTKTHTKDRIMFEDDQDNDDVNNLLQPSQMFVFGSKKPEIFSPSVHYDDLTVPNYYKCRYCEHVSGNRFESVIHDTGHIKTKTRFKSLLCVYCDVMIAGNYHCLRRHITISHPNQDLCPKRRHQKCDECGLTYHNISQHTLLYHHMYKCYQCKKGFVSKLKLTEHTNSKCLNSVGFMPRRERLVKMCEVCFMLRKESASRKYVYVDTISDIGKHQVCYRCNKQTFSIRLVKLITISAHGMYATKNSKWKSKAMAKIEGEVNKMKNTSRYSVRSSPHSNEIIFSNIYRNY